MRSEAANRQVKKRQRSQWPKSDLRYWSDVVYRPAHQHPDGTTQKSEYYVVRLGARSSRESWCRMFPSTGEPATPIRTIGFAGDLRFLGPRGSGAGGTLDTGDRF